MRTLRVDETTYALEWDCVQEAIAERQSRDLINSVWSELLLLKRLKKYFEIECESDDNNWVHVTFEPKTAPACLKMYEFDEWLNDQKVDLEHGITTSTDIITKLEPAEPAFSVMKALFPDKQEEILKLSSVSWKPFVKETSVRYFTETLKLWLYTSESKSPTDLSEVERVLDILFDYCETAEKDSQPPAPPVQLPRRWEL
jgi:hypothetical protein